MPDTVILTVALLPLVSGGLCQRRLTLLKTLPAHVAIAPCLAFLFAFLLAAAFLSFAALAAAVAFAAFFFSWSFFHFSW